MRAKDGEPYHVAVTEDQIKCLEHATEELRELRDVQEKIREEMGTRRRRQNLPLTGSISVVKESLEYAKKAHEFFNRSTQALRDLGRLRIEPTCECSISTNRLVVRRISCVFSDCRGDYMSSGEIKLQPDTWRIGTAFLSTLFESDYPNGGWVRSRCDLNQCLEILSRRRTVVLTYQPENNADPKPLQPQK